MTVFQLKQSSAIQLSDRQYGDFQILDWAHPLLLIYSFGKLVP